MYQDMKSAFLRVFRKARNSHRRRNRSRALQLRLGCEALEERRLLDASLQGPTEARFWDDTSAYNGYTLFAAEETSYLIDMEGQVVNTWAAGTNPRLLDNGNLLDAATDDATGFEGFQQLDWDGNVAWSYYETRGDYDPHDDFMRIFNSELNEYTTLYIADKSITHAEAIAAGADPAHGPYDGAEIDTIVEVDMGGNVVWEWSFFDHVVQDIDPAKGNYVGAGSTIADYPGKIDLNLPGRPLSEEWLVCNSLDYNPDLDQIVINSEQGEFYVIDHGSTFVAGDPTASITLAAGDTGDFLYRFGDPARYEQGNPPSVSADWTKATTGHKQIGASHDVQWIDAGLPGEGNFLVFNNGQYLFETTAQSYVFEINPRLDSGGNDTGDYVNPPDAGYYTFESPRDMQKEKKNISNQVVWMYNTESNLTLFSHLGSGAQRLPNGNTLIHATTEGYLLEVTADGDVAWEYISPVTVDGVVTEIGDNAPMTNAVPAALRYGADHPAFVGQDMTAGATITGTAVHYIAGPADYAALQGPTEVRYWDETNAYNGYTLFGMAGNSYLLDMQGRVVNSWPIGTNPRLLDYNGNLLDASTDDPSGFDGFQELDWDGNLVWQHLETRTDYAPHHDFVRIYNSDLGEYTTLYIANKTITHDEAIAAGADPANGSYDGSQMDAIVEVDMDGNIVWEWRFFDHVVQDIDPTKANYVGAGNTIADHPGKIDINLPGRPLKRDWLHCNSLDYNPDLDQIVINSVQGEAYIIDHGGTFVAGDPDASIALAATDAGDFLYRFGDPARYEQGDPAAILEDWTTSTPGHKQMGGTHDIQWIDPGLPGAGNLLVFNNGQYLHERTPQSYILEINPMLDAGGTDTGAYVNPPDAGYTTRVPNAPEITDKQPMEISNQIVWSYSSESNLTMFSQIGSGAQRLPNGNTLICAMQEGHLLEVTPDGQLVWEYINPVIPGDVVTVIGDNLPMTNAMFRAYRYGPDDPAFVGRDMTPGDPITGPITGGSGPVISGTDHTPAQPAASDPVWVTTTVTDDGSVADVTLSYGSGGGGGGTTVFLETMGTAAVKPWTGDGADNQWTVTASVAGHLEQRTQANYGDGNPAGLEFGTGTNDENQTMIETAQAINAAGDSGFVEFWVWAGDLEDTDGWTFQLDSGSGYVTRLSELTGSSHDWQLYHYDLQQNELVSDLKMRFQFRAGDQGDRIRLDYISVVMDSGGGGGGFTDVPMFDDGAHQDGAADDGVYGVQIPAAAAGTTVSYYVTATDDGGDQSTDPPAAPGQTHSYTVAAAQSDQTVGLFAYDVDRSYNGYTLFAPKHNTNTYLIDNYGRVVHSWTLSTYEPGQSVYLLENGNLLRTCFTHNGSTGGGEGGRIEEYDWNGNLVWELDYATDQYMSHHDIAVLPNGNFLMLVVERKTYAEVLAAGFNPDLLHPDIESKDYMLPDSVVEIERVGTNGANVVWEWHVWDHLIQDFDPAQDNYGVVGDHPELVDPNGWIEGDKNQINAFWNHMNSINYNAEFDQIMLSVRGSSELWVIDHSTTTAEAAGHTGGNSGLGGDLMYRWGNPVTYDAGTEADQMLFDQHDAQWIEAGLPGEGNILIFNNGLGRNYSSVDEILSPMDANGNYPLAAGSAYEPDSLAWTYAADPPSDMYEEAISGAHRLPNGNTLICSGTHGEFLEVTPAGEIVWHYINPEVNTGILTQGEDPAVDDRGHLYNAVFKIHRYSPDYAAFAGRDLTPSGQLELYDSPAISGAAHSPASPTSTDSVWVTATVTDNSAVMSVTLTYDAGSGPATVTMFDDGAHQDGAAGDGLYGGQIPAASGGATVDYFITATDNAGGVTLDPVPAPATTYSYSVTGHPSSWTMLALPDTGQTGDYTATLGEDSDYTVNPPSFSDNGNGTLTDNVTGLMWQQADGGEMTWDNAVAYAESLTLGGHSDWRLPFSHELFSIIDHGSINPSIDTDYFTASNAQYWWSIDQRGDDPARIWAANAGGGIGPHPKDETISAGGTKRFHVLAVRDVTPTAVSDLGGDFTDNGNGTVTDNHTGLVWQQAEVAAPMSWEEALAYAESLSLAGYDDWRLPNIKELRSISDDDLSGPSIDTAYFPAAQVSKYWSSTTQINDDTQAWLIESQFGLVAYDAKTSDWYVRAVRGGIETELNIPEVVSIPAGQFDMGDHHDLGGLEHQSDEVPIHTVSIDAFSMGATEITNSQYRDYLNSALSQGLIEVRNGYVYAVGGNDVYAETTGAAAYSGIEYNGTTFTVVAGREQHPMVGTRWHGAAAYTNWLSALQGYEPCYDLATWECDFSASGYRLPTEAEWEYAARGGDYYNIFPWGNDENQHGTLANWPNSGDPYETGDLPWTTPVGFYDGQLHAKGDFNWPGSDQTYQTANGSNDYGLYDMSGNVWEWTNDWYAREYYDVSPSDNPTGPATGDPMPDGDPYHVLRGGNWYNGEDYWGHGRAANRNPGYYRGPDDPDHAYYHVGFRIVLDTNAVSVVEPGATLVELTSGLQFAEGPAADATGNVFFSDVAADIVYTYSTGGQLSVFLQNSGGANGLFFDAQGNLIACESDNGRIVSIDPQGTVTVLAEEYGGIRFNEPNDLWIDPQGGIYFSDPVYWGAEVQDGQHVYYLTPDSSSVVRVIDDMVRPNGMIGTPDGQMLYVSDHGGGAVYRYDIQADGTLANKTLFAAVASDGMTIDNEGNIYLTENAVLVFDSAGSQIDEIAVPERPTNVTFGGSDAHTLFITTEHSLQSIRMRVHGVTVPTPSPAVVLINEIMVDNTATIEDPDEPGAYEAWLELHNAGGSEADLGGLYLSNKVDNPTRWQIPTGLTIPAGGHLLIWADNEPAQGDTHAGFRLGANSKRLFLYDTDGTTLLDSIQFSTQLTDISYGRYPDGADDWGYMPTPTPGLANQPHGDISPIITGTGTSVAAPTAFNAVWVTATVVDDNALASVTLTYDAGAGPVDVVMYDDGVHADGEANDNLYSGKIPAQPPSTVVSYYITAVDNATNLSADPGDAPAGSYAYTVRDSYQDLLLGQLTDSSVTVSVLADRDLDVYLEYGTQPGVYSVQTNATPLPAGVPLEVTFDQLQPDTRYYYRLLSREPGELEFQIDQEHTFHTQRAADSPFTFVVAGDPHMLDNRETVYQAALGNVLADSPDFLVDLGDTFMTEKWGVDTQEGAVELVENARTSFHSLIGHSVPSIMLTGNHEAELGWLLDDANPQNNIAVWATEARQEYYPGIVPGDFYSGSTSTDPYLQDVRDSYYSYEWGGAQFVVLDPFWYTTTRPGRSGDPWDFTLGQEQYDWLQQTLAASDAELKFVFIHHLVGGTFDGDGRGGLEVSSFFEWGGYNADGTWGFDTQRPGWSAPIQDILLANGVDVVFHGHDHFVAKQDLDHDGDGQTDLVYMLSPQPGNAGYGGANSAADYGYSTGDIMNNSGHLRVTVDGSQATVDYVRAYAPEDETAERVNGEVAYSFTIQGDPTLPHEFGGNIVLGRPTDDSIAANVLSPDQTLDVYFEIGTQPGVYTTQTDTMSLVADIPLETVFDSLQADTQYYYRMDYALPGGTGFLNTEEYTFHTQRAPGSTFTFGIQGDSHPERGSQFDSEMYTRTLDQAASDGLDFYIGMGDDFSVDTLDPATITAADVAERYLIQRPYLGIVGNSAPVYLVNGNHEQAAAYLLDGTPDNVAVWAQNARNEYYSEPAPDGFYTGNAEPVEYIGLLRNYYAWTWGDALFITIDPYWSSPVPVDNVFGGGDKTSDNWEITLGDVQYEWLKTTLEQSDATYKFVFAHHVHGTGRGGIEQAPFYEWGGYNADGTWGFDTERPDWDLPIHDLMVANDVSIFFQGHDHIFVTQELDGVIYQTLPEPGDPNYALENADAFESDIELPNTGYTRVTVAPEGVTVEYVRTFLPEDEGPGQTSGMVAHSYTVGPQTMQVTSLTATDSGFVAELNREFETSVLNLYDQHGQPALSDVTFMGDTVGPVPGSVVIDPTSRQVSFIKTGGVLEPDTYTVTLRSADDGFRDTDGALLDGDGDGLAGGDYVFTFSVAADTAPVLSIPDFSRGPQQDVDVPATAAGIPLSLSDANGVIGVDFTFQYDPALLDITDFALSDDLQTLGWEAEFNLLTPGEVKAILYNSTALTAGEVQLGQIQASIPTDAPYGSSTILSLEDVLLNEGAIPVKADDAVQTVAYFGDTTGNGTYSGLDAAYVARIAVGLDSGFSAFPLCDPQIVGDVTGNDSFSGLDAAYIARKAVGLPVEAIPDLPNASGQALHIEPPPAESQTAAPNVVGGLTEEQLAPVVQAAISRIESAGPPESIATLSDVTVEIVDLPNGLLGRQIGQLIIQIDIDASGYGWFVDTTPWDDAEFTALPITYDLTALPGTSAAGRADLLTTVLHELGHVLGFDHDDDGVMDETLPLGTRRLWDDELPLFGDSTFANHPLAESRPTEEVVDEIFANCASS